MRSTFIVLAILAFPGAIWAQTCDSSPQSRLTHGFFSPFTAYGAAQESPSVFQLRAASFEVQISRSSVAASSSMKLEIRRASEPQTILCTSGWVSVEDYYLQLQGEQVETWLVYVFVKDSGGPTADEADVPNVSFGSATDPVTVEPKSKQWELARGPSGTCTVTETPLHPTATLERVLSDTLRAADAGQLIGRYRFHSGRLIYIALKRSGHKQEQGPKLLIRAYAKDNQDSPFQLACEQELPSEMTSRWTLAVGFPGGRGFDPLWMIEITCSASCLPGPLPVSLEVHREEIPAPPHDVDTRNNSSPFRALEYFCYSGPGIYRKPRMSSQDVFAGTTQLQIHIVAPQVPKATVHTLESYFLAAISLWRRACLDCVPDHLSVVKLNDRLFLDSELAGWLFSLDPKEISPTDKDSMLEPGNVFFWFRGIIGGRRLGMRADSGTYLEISSDERRWKSLCSVPTAYLPDPVRRVQNALPCTKAGRKAGLGVEFKLASKGLSCGRSLNTVACEKLGANVELNIKDFSFSAVRSLQVVVGGGPTRVDLMQVLLHEIGHWIGIPHTRPSPSIDLMDQYYESGKCIENSSVDSLQRVIANRLRFNEMAPSELKFGRETGRKRTDRKWIRGVSRPQRRLP